MAIHVRAAHVIARREELLEHHLPKGETHERSAWYDARERRVVISGSDRSWILEAHPVRKKCTEIDFRRLPKKLEDSLVMLSRRSAFRRLGSSH
jgi:hypothetical protein